jgi:UDP-N-acetyl-D-mannosaminuronate dehydrogenase
MKLVEYSRKTNDFMPKKCVNDAVKLLETNKIKIPGSKIAVLGLGFRGEVTDTRLSPTYVVVDEFLKLGCKISIHDPFIFKDSSLQSGVKLADKMTEVTKDASLIFISSDHKMYSKLTSKSFSNAKKPLLIFDGRNILNQNNFKNSSLLTIGKR